MTPIEIYVEYTYTFNVSEEELRAAVHYGRDGLRKTAGETVKNALKREGGRREKVPQRGAPSARKH
jgi:hypothetical protein